MRSSAISACVADQLIVNIVKAGCNYDLRECQTAKCAFLWRTSPSHIQHDTLPCDHESQHACSVPQHSILNVKRSLGSRVLGPRGALRALHRDGESHNLTWNCGAEGGTAKKSVLRLRQRQMRNLAAALLLSHGVPMILMGDEYGHSKV